MLANREITADNGGQTQDLRLQILMGHANLQTLYDAAGPRALG